MPKPAPEKNILCFSDTDVIVRRVADFWSISQRLAAEAGSGVVPLMPRADRLRRRWEPPRRHGTPGYSPLSATAFRNGDFAYRRTGAGLCCHL